MTLITLQVGERRYFSEEKTLIEGSDYFKAARFCGHLKDKKEADGSYFIDRDGHLFEYILSFLRTGICPLFYDNINGFDHAKYVRLGAEAEYFGVKKLCDWIIAKKYEQVISFTRRVSLMEDLEDLDDVATAGDKAQLIPMWRTRKVYLCPRRLEVHRGKPESCGRACDKARSAYYGAEYQDEQELVVVMIWFEKAFRPSVLKP